MGADDYIIKPFDLDEVLVRIEVVLRRSEAESSSQSEEEVLSHNGLVLDREQNSVMFSGTALKLTSKELQLLELFLRYPQKTFTKANLYETVWGEPYYYEDNTINVHLSNLRSKLKKATGKEFVETVWGIGYRLEASE
jgi:DNA-binding response OmpR family regulator